MQLALTSPRCEPKPNEDWAVWDFPFAALILSLLPNKGDGLLILLVLALLLVFILVLLFVKPVVDVAAVTVVVVLDSVVVAITAGWDVFGCTFKDPQVD